MGGPSPCHVIERDAWHLFPLKNQRVGNNRDSPLRAERTTSSRTQPHMNEPELGDSVPIASSPPPATLATSGEVWRRPSNCRRGTGGTGSGSKPLSGSHPMRSSPSLPTWLACHADPRYWTNANSGDRNWHFGGKLHIRLPGRRSRSLFPAFRATHGSGFRRWGKMYRLSGTSSSGTLGCFSHSRIRGSATTVGSRFAPRGQPPCERSYR